MDPTTQMVLTQLALTLPATLTVAVIVVLAVLRRDAGTWWKLVLAGGLVLVLSQLVSIAGSAVIYSVPYATARVLTFVISGVAVAVQVIGLALLGAGAIIGRRTRVEAT